MFDQLTSFFYSVIGPGTVLSSRLRNDVTENTRKKVSMTPDTTDLTTQFTLVEAVIFRGLVFALFGFDLQKNLALTHSICKAGGTTTTDDDGKNDFSKTVHYVVVPGDNHDLRDIPYTAKESVTDLWLVSVQRDKCKCKHHGEFFGKNIFDFLSQQDCLTANKVVDIKYYHRAISFGNTIQPLIGSIIVCSTYTSSERDYLNALARALGGEINDCYKRSQKPILICPAPLGDKYAAAIKWRK